MRKVHAPGNLSRGTAAHNGRRHLEGHSSQTTDPSIAHLVSYMWSAGANATMAHGSQKCKLLVLRWLLSSHVNVPRMVADCRCIYSWRRVRRCSGQPQACAVAQRTASKQCTVVAPFLQCDPRLMGHSRPSFDMMCPRDPVYFAVLVLRRN